MNRNIALLALLLTGCATSNVVIKKDETTNRQLCQLTNTHLDSELYIRANLNIQKDDTETLCAWIKFSPKNTTQVPQNNPKLIFKIKSADQLIEKIILQGEQVAFSGLFFNRAINEYKEKENAKDLKVKEDDVYNDRQMKIARSIWPYNSDRAFYAFQYNSGEHAVFFTITSNIFHKLMSAQEVEILIQTDENPLKFFLKEKQILSIKEFKVKCSVK